MEDNILVESPKETEKLLPDVIRSEVNLLVLPFFALWSKDNKQRTETEYKTVVKRHNKKLEVSWTITSNSKYGYPGPFDRSVHKAIEQIISGLTLPIQNPIQIGSIYSLIERMGLNTKGGQIYRKVKEALQRITLTGIVSKGVFYDKQEEQWIEDTFHLYERVIFKGKKLPDGGIADTNYVYLNSWYIDNINARYVKPIDWKYYKSLKTPIAQRLYEILSVKFYGVIMRGDRCVSYRYSTLCDLLPITRQHYRSLAMRIMDPAHDKLKGTTFLENYEWEELSLSNGGNDWLIRYYPGKRAKDEISRFKIGEQLELSLSNESTPASYDLDTTTIKNSQELAGNQTVNQLIQRGITKSVADVLINDYSTDQIQKQIEIFDYLVKIKSQLVAKNPAGFLRKSIEENYQPPSEYNRKQEKEITEQKRLQERVEKEAEQARLDEIQCQIDEYRDNLTDEEKQLLRQETIELIENDKQIRKEFVTEHLIRAKENEIIRDRLGLGE